jgi:hypothetical protein
MSWLLCGIAIAALISMASLQGRRARTALGGARGTAGGMQQWRWHAWRARRDACRKQSSHRDSPLREHIAHGHRFLAGEVGRRSS